MYEVIKSKRSIFCPTYSLYVKFNDFLIIYNLSFFHYAKLITFFNGSNQELFSVVIPLRLMHCHWLTVKLLAGPSKFNQSKSVFINVTITALGNEGVELLFKYIRPLSSPILLSLNIISAYTFLISITLAPATHL